MEELPSIIKMLFKTAGQKMELNITFWSDTTTLGFEVLD